MNDSIDDKPKVNSLQLPRICHATLIMLSSLACFSLSSGAEAKTLRWKLTPGQQYQFTVERVVNQKSPIVQWSETVRCELLWRVASKADNGIVEIVQTLVSVEHSLRFPDTPVISYDSLDDGEARGDAAVLAKRWAGKIKAEQRMMLKPNGELAISEPEPTSTSASSTSTPAVSGLPVSAGTADWQPIPKVLQRTECILPLVDMPEGYNWSTTQTIPWGDDDINLKLTTVYNYQGTKLVDEIPQELVNSTTRWEVVPKPGTVTPLVIEQQQGTGTISFDANAGYLARADRSEELIVRILRPGVEPTQASVETTMKVRCEPLESVPVATEEESQE